MERRLRTMITTMRGCCRQRMGWSILLHTLKTTSMASLGFTILTSTLTLSGLGFPSPREIRIFVPRPSSSVYIGDRLKPLSGLVGKSLNFSLLKLFPFFVGKCSNESIGVGMCPETQWQKLAKGSWVQAVSPFGNRIIDIRMLPDSSRSIEVSTELEFLLHRLLFLVIGFIMMLMARVLSESVVFYYGSFMTVGVIIVILIVLFQGMKLLPTGRKSSLAIVLYSSIVGVATFVLHYLSGLLRSILLEIGISEDNHNPLGIFLLVCLVLAGACFGYWGVRKLVLTDDGLVDSELSYFVEWAILIFAADMILQFRFVKSSLDTLLAAEALIFAIVTTAVARIHGKWRFFQRLFKRTWRGVHAIQDRTSPMSYFSDYPYHVQKSGSKLHGAQARSLKSTSYNFPTQRVNKTPEVLSETGTYYSTFHKTPERKRFSKEEWEQFTKESTRETLRELVSSPDFNKRAMDNAERITLTPPNANIRQRKHRRFLWFYAS